MGVATLGTHRFRLDPSGIKWDYSITSKVIYTVGGRVVQILGSKLGNLTVTGDFGRGGFQEQERFLKTMENIGDAHVGNLRGGGGAPIRFKYPPRGWDFGVYLTGYRDPRGSNSVKLDDTITAPQWQLTLFIVEGGEALKRISEDKHIQRLSEGIGWKQTAYNGPMGAQDVNTSAGGGGSSLPYASGNRPNNTPF